MSQSQSRPDEYYMALAIREAERGLYTTQPNPRVGCVLVKNGEIISTGFHLQTGSGHAEANAIAAAVENGDGEKLKGATAYVTLEPCSFRGRTASCAEALIKHGVSRVVYAATDPHPGNCGKGLEKLKDAGIAVVGPVMEASASALNPGHIRKFVAGMPYVRLKLAMSLDGKTALANGKSQWITSPEARRDVQKLRARSCAIVTGVQTVIDDDPGLTVRVDELDIPEAEISSKLARPIIVLDSNGRLPKTARLLENPALLVATLNERPGLGAAQEIIAANDQGQIDLRQLLKRLAELDCNEVLFECGATLAGSLIRARLVDEIVIYMAPVLLGGQARSLVDLGELVEMSDATSLNIIDCRSVGADLRITASLADAG